MRNWWEFEGPWKLKPFGEGVPLPYRNAFDHEQFTRLMKGREPESNDDHFIIHYEEPYLFFHRTWGGTPIYRVKLTALASGAVVTEALWSQHLALTAPPIEGPVFQARLLDFLVSTILLGLSRPVPRPEGKAYTSEASKRWWRLS
jgi:hypothetical protein